MQGIFQKENTDKALKYGIYRHLPTYEKIIRNLVSFFSKKYPPSGLVRRAFFVILISSQRCSGGRHRPPPHHGGSQSKPSFFPVPHSLLPKAREAPRTVCSGGSAFSCYFPMYALRMAAISARVAPPSGARWLLSRPTMSRRAFAHCIASFAQAGICPASL